MYRQWRCRHSTRVQNHSEDYEFMVCVTAAGIRTCVMNVVIVPYRRSYVFCHGDKTYTITAAYRFLLYSTTLLFSLFVLQLLM